MWLLVTGEAFLECAVEVPVPARYEAPVVGVRELCEVARVAWVREDVRRQMVAGLVVEVRAPWR